MHGMHGGFDVMPRMLERAKESLNLNTSQQTMWDAVVAQGKAAREAGRANRGSVKDALAAELAKAEPDLAAVAAAADAVEQQNRALRRQVRDQWLALYATFSPEQKAVVRDTAADAGSRGRNRSISGCASASASTAGCRRLSAAGPPCPG